jgi:beta-glucanase (GH16 family)
VIRTNRARLVILALSMATLWVAVSPSDASPTLVRGATSAPASPSCGPTLLKKASGGYWQCTLAEEFNGTTLNRRLWVPVTTADSGFHSGPECFVDSPNNMSVGNGVMTLTVRKEAAPFTCRSPFGDYKTQYTSEQISTFRNWAQAYGRFEVRAKVPNTPKPGLQTSLWLWPDKPEKYGPWPIAGEIDIAEMYSWVNDRAIPFVHYNNYLDPDVTNNYCFVRDLGQFHTYTVEWTKDTLTFMYDGRTCLVDNWKPSAPQSKPQPFDQPFIVALTQLLGVGNNAFDPNKTPLPASTQVDYVRVWK